MRTVGRNAAVPGEVLIVTGPAAAGKTTAARRVAEESTQPSVHLHGDDFFRALKTGRLRGWVDSAEAQHGVVFEAIGSAAAVYATGGYFVVVDTLVRRQFLETVVGTVERNDIAVDLVVLRPSFDEVRARSDRRDPRLRHEAGILRWLYDSFRDLGDLEAHVIDNSDLSPDQTVEAIRAIVRSGVARLRPSDAPGP